jgi:hypothetical protein
MDMHDDEQAADMIHMYALPANGNTLPTQQLADEDL